MEFAIYLLVSGSCAVAMFFAAVNAARKPGQPQRGPFRISEDTEPGAAQSAQPVSSGRSGPWRPAR